MQHPISTYNSRLTHIDGRTLGRALAGVGVVAVFYFLGARFGLSLRTEDGGVAVFWPASGIAAGIVLARGRSAWLPVALGVMVATVAANVLDDRNLITAFGKGLCNAGEAILVAWLVERWFGPTIKLDNVTRIVGFVCAAVLAAAVAAVGGAATMRTFHAIAPLPELWRAWFLANLVGLVAVTPLLISLVQIAHGRLPRRDLMEGGAVLVGLCLMARFVFALPAGTWPSLVPVTILLPALLLIAARYHPALSGIAGFVVAITIVWSTIVGIGSFGDANVPLAQRVFAAQAAALIVTLYSLVLAALFSERRGGERTLKLSNDRLQESNQRLQLALGGARLGTFSIDIKSGRLECDPRAAQMHGFDKKKPLTIKECRRFIDRNDRCAVGTAFDEARRTGGVWSAKYRITYPSNHASAGQTRWIALDGSISRNARGQPSRLIGVTRDITAEKVSESKLHDQMAAEYEVLSKISAGVQLYDVLEGLIRTAEAQSDAGMIASILFLDKEGKRLLHGAAPNLPHTYNDAINGVEIGPDVGSCGSSAYLGEPVFVADIASDPLWVEYREVALSHGLRACSSTPIKAVDGRVLGTFAIYYREARLPSPADLEAIALVTHTAALAIERHISEQVVRESQERLQLALDGAKLGVWSVDLRTGEFENDSRDRLHHKHDEKAPPRTVAEARDFVESEDLPLVDAAFIRARIAGRCAAEYRIRGSARDRPIWLAVEGTVLHDSMGTPTRLLGVTRDITEQRLAEQSLREQEQAFRRLLGALPAAIYTTDVAGHITYCNQSAVDLWGCNPEIGRDKWHEMSRFYYANGEPMPIEACPSAIALNNGSAIRGHEAILERHDGSRIPIMPCPTPLRDGSGAIVGIVNMMINLTEQKEAERALSERSAQLELAERATLVGSFSTDIGSRSFRFSPGFAALLDLPDNANEVALASWRSRVHPEDRRHLEASRKRAFAARKREHSAEYRIVRPSGEIRWIEGRNVTSYDSSGRPLRMLGVNIDVTERKHAELHKSTLIAELDHRVKNTLSCVSVMARHSGGTSRSIDEFLEDFDARIGSLANTHMLLSRSRWGGVRLGELVGSELAPCRPNRNTSFDGPDVLLAPSAAQPVAMVIHELATNAAKYGALSNPNGKVSVRWTCKGNKLKRSNLIVQWREMGGPTVKTPVRDGYGTTVIRDLIPYELGGRVSCTFAPQGLQCRLEIPTRWVSWNAPRSTSTNSRNSPDCSLPTVYVNGRSGA